MTYEELLIESESQNLIVKEKNLPGYNGRIYKNRIAISKNLNMSEKKCVLAEELGHHHTSVGNILNMEDLSNRKQDDGYGTAGEVEVEERLFDEADACLRTGESRFGGNQQIGRASCRERV